MNKARRILSWKVPCLFLLLCALPGCQTLINDKPPIPWHECYEPLDSPAAEAFVFQALEEAVPRFGKPAVPVGSLQLRRSRKTSNVRNYRLAENFTLTECVDSDKGEFVIYMAVEPGHESFYPLLGHECFHLLNPMIFDWYMEGAATVFSEEICRANGVSWATWEKRFRRDKHRKPYSASYWMMKELKEAVPSDYPRFLRFTVPAAEEDRRQIDIDAWLNTLPASDRAQAVDVISRWMKILKRRASEDYNFTVPKELKQ
ncbi:MAG: hypothetical protein K9M45_05220 [Kiritimatiellales bacterium]|nr:hypothetical protein [Kiritimatiellales bacterium]